MRTYYVYLVNVWPMNFCIPLREVILPFDYALKIEHWSMLLATNEMTSTISNVSIHTSFFLSVIQTSCNNFLDWRSSNHLICFIFMSSYHHPMNSTRLEFLMKAFFSSWSVNLSMKIPSDNPKDIKYPHQQMFPFNRCMMNLVLDDLAIYVSNENPKSYILYFHRF